MKLPSDLYTSWRVFGGSHRLPTSHSPGLSQPVNMGLAMRLAGCAAIILSGATQLASFALHVSSRHICLLLKASI